MKNESLIVSVSSINNLDKITKDTRYINIDVNNPNYEIIAYFLDNGEHYHYSDMTDHTKGYNYISYERFKKAENIIDMIYANMPSNLTKIEMAKYIYISLGKILSFDINSNSAKNEVFNLSLATTIDNIWGSISESKVNSKSCAKIYNYLCKRLDIDSTIIYDKKTNSYQNKLKINNQVLLTNLFKDIPFIQSNMQTRYFATYNDDTKIDKKIKYLKTKYNDEKIDNILKNIDYTKEECVNLVLSKTEKILDVDNIKPTELSIIYKYIFDKYCPNYDIKINNLYLNEHSKKHFIMFSYNDEHYSYNYKEKRFIKVSDEDIIDNINNNKIGLYLDEYIPNISNYIECIN